MGTICYLGIRRLLHILFQCHKYIGNSLVVKTALVLIPALLLARYPLSLGKTCHFLCLNVVIYKMGLILIAPNPQDCDEDYMSYACKVVGAALGNI